MASIPISVPRLCHIVKIDQFDGFGFNLYQEKTRAGQFIGRIEPGSPAERGGLKEDDKIVEVNGVDIAKERHAQVVGRIQAIASETTMLVIDKECEDYHSEHGIVIKQSLPYVEYLSSDGATSEDEELVETFLPVRIVEDNPGGVNGEEDQGKESIEAVTEEVYTKQYC